jgi:lipoprotein-anchoring transpeptidase ErfK/SrfK
MSRVLPRLLAFIFVVASVAGFTIAWSNFASSADTSPYVTKADFDQAFTDVAAGRAPTSNLSIATVAADCAMLCSIAHTGHALTLGAQQSTAALPEIGRPDPPAQPPARLDHLDVTTSPVKPVAKEHHIGAAAKGTLGIIVSLEKQQLTLYADGQPVAHSRVSTGKPGHGTPTGVFSIIEKDRWHHSNLYDNAPMYFMQRITSSGVALHQGIVPNYPASHGCVRLPEAFARQLWGITKTGVRVIITRGEVAPTDISHPRLFAPSREQLEAAAASSRSSAHIADVTFETSRLRYAMSDSAMIAGMNFGEPGPTLISSERLANTFTEPVALGTALPAGNAPAQERTKSGPVSVFISRKEGRLFVRKSPCASLGAVCGRRLRACCIHATHSDFDQ